MRPTSSYSAGRRRRMLLGIVLLPVLAAFAGLAAYLTQGGGSAPKAQGRAAPSAPPAAARTPDSPPRGVALPAPPRTHDPVTFGKAAAVALWSYDTRVYSRDALLGALRGWMTGEKRYADTASVDALVPPPMLWREMSADGQYATAEAAEAHFPNSFVQALQTDPGAITAAYIYAVTVTGHEAIGWQGAPRGGGEARATTLAVQCRPSRPCSLVGVLPNLAP